jgi:Predicted hydrolase (metallo-beta-lactamase superfamily)
MDALLVFRFAADFSSPANGPCTAVGSPIPQAPVTTPTPAPSHSPTPTPPLGGPPLEIDHIDVGQGNAALIIAPDGETAMIDDGRWTNCTPTVSYVTGKGITHIDYHFATHYDADHIGCLGALVNAGVSVGECLDHGGSKNTQTFANYVAACGANRQTAYKGEVITLDAASANPVSIKVVDLNGAGVSVSPSDENALGLDMKLTYGSFSHEFGGDMPGEDPDIESVVGPEVGHVDVCTVHHHGSKYSSTDDWLNDLTPAVCVLSVGNNSYGHPTAEALGRLHAHGVQVYWTETGSGAEPGPMDHVCNSTVTITVSLPDNYAVNCGKRRSRRQPIYAPNCLTFCARDMLTKPVVNNRLYRHPTEA